MSPANKERAERARSVLLSYIPRDTDGFSGKTVHEDIADLITDLLHFAKLKRKNIDKLLGHARLNFDLETSAKGKL